MENEHREAMMKMIDARREAASATMTEFQVLLLKRATTFYPNSSGGLHAKLALIDWATAEIVAEAELGPTGMIEVLQAMASRSDVMIESYEDDNNRFDLPKKKW